MPNPLLLSPQPMHIPDGFLSVLVSIVFWTVSMVVIGIALRRTNKDLGERRIPLMGVMAAAIFAGQMLNFSVSGGTSGHLLGAALATIVLGPWAAVLVMTSVVSVQALVFQDGGILALGANIFNMAIVGVFVSHAAYSILQSLIGKHPRGLFVSGFIAALLSIFVASLSCSIQLALSGTSPANVVIPAMSGIHALIGIGEGLITSGALAVMLTARRDLLHWENPQNSNTRGIVAGGILIGVILAVLAPLASNHPDGLEWVAEQNQFLHYARNAFYQLIPDYAFPGISSQSLATIVAGIIGVVIVFGVALGMGRVQRQRRSKGNPQD